jgi:hypothetical protein
MPDRHLDENGYVRAPDDAELRAQAIAQCRLCDTDGYRGSSVCDHNPDQAAINARGIAACRAALTKEPRK